MFFRCASTFLATNVPAYTIQLPVLILLFLFGDASCIVSQAFFEHPTFCLPFKKVCQAKNSPHFSNVSFHCVVLHARTHIK